MFKRNFKVYSDFDGVNIVCKSAYGHTPIGASTSNANMGSVRRKYKYDPLAHYKLGKPSDIYIKATSELASKEEKPTSSKAVELNAKTLRGRKLLQKGKTPSKMSKKVEEAERTLRHSRERLRLLDDAY